MGQNRSLKAICVAVEDVVLVWSIFRKRASFVGMGWVESYLLCSLSMRIGLKPKSLLDEEVLFCSG